MIEAQKQTTTAFSTILVGQATSLDQVRSDFNTKCVLESMGISQQVLTQLFNASSDTMFIPAEVRSGLYIYDAAGEAVIVGKEHNMPVVLAGGPSNDVILIDVTKKQ